MSQILLGTAFFVMFLFKLFLAFLIYITIREVQDDPKLKGSIASTITTTLILLGTILFSL